MIKKLKLQKILFLVIICSVAFMNVACDPDTGVDFDETAFRAWINHDDRVLRTLAGTDISGWAQMPLNPQLVDYIIIFINQNWNRNVHTNNDVTFKDLTHSYFDYAPELEVLRPMRFEQ